MSIPRTHKGPWGHRLNARHRIVWLCCLLLAAFEAGACPACTYERQLASYWHFKWAAINLLVPLVLVSNRLDVVRSLYVLIPNVLLSFQLHSFLFWHTFAIQNRVLDFAATLGWWVFGLNLLGVVGLYGMSRFEFFRRKKDEGLAVWQPVAYSVTVLALTRMIAP